MYYFSATLFLDKSGFLLGQTLGDGLPLVPMHSIEEVVMLANVFREVSKSGTTIKDEELLRGFNLAVLKIWEEMASEYSKASPEKHKRTYIDTFFEVPVHLAACLVDFDEKSNARSSFKGRQLQHSKTAADLTASPFTTPPRAMQPLQQSSCRH